MTFWTDLDQAEERERRRIKRMERDGRIVDDVCSCIQCREGLTHIRPCEREAKQ